MAARARLARLDAGRALMFGSIGLLSLAAWVVLWQFKRSPYAHAVHHAAVGDFFSGIFGVVFVGGWTLMTIAMMLPASLPVVATFHTLASSRRERPLLVALVIAGYLVTWVSFGVAVYGVQVLALSVLGAGPWIDEHVPLVRGLTLLSAGLYQFSGLKYRCLDKCRSPLSFVIEHWQGQHYRSQAFRLGVHHGLFCVGCCWTLMLLMLVVGVGNLAWMLALAAVMAVEKSSRWGRWLTVPVGVGLIGWGALTLLLA